MQESMTSFKLATESFCQEMANSCFFYHVIDHHHAYGWSLAAMCLCTRRRRDTLADEWTARLLPRNMKHFKQNTCVIQATWLQRAVKHRRRRRCCCHRLVCQFHANHCKQFSAAAAACLILLYYYWPTFRAEMWC